MSSRAPGVMAPLNGWILGAPDLVEVVTARHRDVLARAVDGSAGISLTQAPCLRSDVLAQRLTSDVDHSTVPDDVREWLAPQVPSGDLAVVVTSLSAELSCEVRLHRASGVLVAVPDDPGELPSGVASWLDEECEPVDSLSVAAIESNIRAIHAALQSHQGSLVLCNISTFVPDEEVRRFDPGTAETMSERISRLDLLADHLAGELDLTLVDIDRLAAELGAGEEVLAVADYSPRLGEAIGSEIVSQIRSLPSLAPMFRSEVMQLTVPGYDRRTTAGEIVAWHHPAHSAVERGDVLFDLRFDHIQEKRVLVPDGKRRTLSVSVLAGDDGFLHSVLIPAGTSVDVGQAAAIVTKSEDTEVDDTDSAAEFPVGVRVITR